MKVSIDRDAVRFVTDDEGDYLACHWRDLLFPQVRFDSMISAWARLLEAYRLWRAERLLGAEKGAVH